MLLWSFPRRPLLLRELLERSSPLEELRLPEDELPPDLRDWERFEDLPLSLDLLLLVVAI
jgi:hypothetical protein